MESILRGIYIRYNKECCFFLLDNDSIVLLFVLQERYLTFLKDGESPPSFSEDV